MSSVIIDPCYFTRQGLSEYLVSHHVVSHSYTGIESSLQLKDILDSISPSLVFISGQCLDNHCPESSEIKDIISCYPDTIFFIFMVLPNGHFNGHLYLRDNIIVTSKALDRQLLDRLITPHLSCIRNSPRRLNQRDNRPVALSRSESDMLRMWMSGYDTPQISDLLQIKAKTISSHKGNIKKKVNTQNKQVIFQLMKISNTLTTGIYTSC